MKVEELSLTGDRVLIKPLKIYTYSVKQIKVNAPTAADGPLELDPDKLEEVVPEQVDQEITSDTQKATVLALGNFANVNCSVGDTIVYNYKSATAFELIKGTALIRQNDVIAIIKK